MDLCFDVCKQVVTRTDSEKVVNLSDNFLRLVFDFKGTDWDDLVKFVLVHHRKGVTRLELTDDMVTLSDGLLYGNAIEVALYGVDDPDDTDYRITANKIRLYLGDSGYVDEYSEIADVITIHTVSELYETLDGKSDVGHTHDDRYYTESEMDTQLDEKVDKVTGKELSSNDFTDHYKGFIDGVEGSVDELLDELGTEMAETINNKAEKVHTHTKSQITDFSHTHNKSDITDFNHSHTKSDISDFSHTHNKSEITDFEHNHDNRYYTQSEVDALIYDLNNKLKLDADKEIIQTNDIVNFRAYYVKDGMPVKNATIEFYKEVEDD